MVSVFSGGSSVSDVAVMASIALMKCSNADVRARFGSFRALGPITWEDNFPTVLHSNIVLILGVSLLHSVAVAVYRRRMPLRDSCVLLWFPSVSFSVIVAVFQGSAFAAIQVPSTVAGTAVLIFVLLWPIGFIGCVRGLVHRHYVSLNYPEGTFTSQWGRFRWFLAPDGILLPLEGVMTRPLSNLRLPGWYWPGLPYFIPVLFTVANIVAPSSPAGCKAQFYALFAVMFGLAAAILVYKPHHLPWNNGITALGIFVNAILLLLSAAAVEDPEYLSGPIASAILALQSLITAVRVACLVLIKFSVGNPQVNLGAVAGAQLWQVPAAQPPDATPVPLDSATVEIQPQQPLLLPPTVMGKEIEAAVEMESIPPPAVPPQITVEETPKVDLLERERMNGTDMAVDSILAQLPAAPSVAAAQAEKVPTQQSQQPSAAQADPFLADDDDDL